jgi:hypothetical protein
MLTTQFEVAQPTRDRRGAAIAVGLREHVMRRAGYRRYAQYASALMTSLPFREASAW